ncbi:MAG TPA: FAD-dependent oxidoreductase [Ktedonobacterales bacterium]
MSRPSQPPHAPVIKRGISPWAAAAPNAPWRASLDPAVERALALNDVATLTDNDFDVIVIGAGVAGLSATVGAATAGARVLALDAAPTIGEGATGRNAGILSAGINMMLADLPNGSPHRAMWPATTRELLGLTEEATHHGSLLSATVTGAISLAETAAAARRLEREARARQALGLRAEIWTAEQVASHTHGRLAVQSVSAALWLPDEGRIQPLTLLARTAEKARAASGVLAGNATVARWEANGKRAAIRWKVSLAQGRAFTARGLIIATGPVVAPTARIYAVAFAIDLPESFPLFWDAAPYTYCDYRPSTGALISSGGRYGRAGGSPQEGAYFQRLARGARHWLPELAAATPTHAWAVDLDTAADLAPNARDLGAAAPGAAIEGLGALGVLPGIILGRDIGVRIASQI